MIVAVVGVLVGVKNSIWLMGLLLGWFGPPAARVTLPPCSPPPLASLLPRRQVIEWPPLSSSRRPWAPQAAGGLEVAQVLALATGVPLCAPTRSQTIVCGEAGQRLG
mgnify:CR=1 FL=1